MTKLHINELRKFPRRLKYEDVSEVLLDFIRKQGLWNQFLAAERELSGMLGVSRKTLRRAMELLERRGIIARRHGQGTLVLPRARRRAARKTGHVVVGSNFAADFGGYMGQIMSGLNAAAASSGWLVSFVNLVAPAARQNFFDQLARAETRGVLLVGITDRGLVEAALRGFRGSLILVDHCFPDLPVTSVTDDSEAGTRQVVEHFLALGHRRIGYVEIAKRELNPWRYAGFAGALRDAGITLDDGLIVPAGPSFDAGRRAGEALLGLANPPTAILAFDDSRAWGVWRAAEARGLVVGRDLAIAGFGDSSTAAGLPEELTSVRIDWREVGQVAGFTLADLIAGKVRSGEAVKVSPRLIIRKSSQDARVLPASGNEGRNIP